jgi:hypothetical protein
MAKVETGKLSDFQPQAENANKHTERGLKALEDAYSEVGYVAPMTAAANGEVLDGSARLEKAVDQFPDEALVIKHDGTKPIVMVREDVKDAKDAKAKRISYGANRIGELDLEWSPEQVLADIEAGIDLSGLFDEDELEILQGIEVDNPYDEWGGMPEFKQEDKTPFRAIKIYFNSQEEVEEFSQLLGQSFTESTKFIYFDQNYDPSKKGFGYTIDES